MIDSQQLGNKAERENQTYEKIKLLGSGSFGKAYLVREIKTQKMFVIKQINLGQLCSSEQETARKQAKILEVLDHPNIIKFKEVYGTSNMKLNIVMEYADGGDLAARIQEAKAKNQHFDEQQILSWFTQICLAIKHIHDRKIIHRDLKGQNIFLTDDNFVKIGDFGVAKVLERTLAKAKTVVGSPYYLSPQIIENRPYSFKTDIWSLGAILFEMCALTPPFTANNIQFLALKIVKGSYQNIPSQYSPDLRELIKQLLNTNPNSRPTINQILSSPIIHKRIKTLLTESQNLKQFSQPIRHHFEIESSEKLRPPPNLLELQENQFQKINSNNIYPQTNEVDGKNKQQNNGKKGVLIRKKIPIYPTRNQKAQQDRLTDLMKITPSPMETHQPVKFPKVSPAIPEKKKVSTPQIMKKIEEVPSQFNSHKMMKKNSIPEINIKSENVINSNKIKQKQSVHKVVERPVTTKPANKKNEHSQIKIQKNKKQTNPPKISKNIQNRKPIKKQTKISKNNEVKLQIKSEEVKQKQHYDNEKEKQKKKLKNKPPLTHKKSQRGSTQRVDEKKEEQIEEGKIKYQEQYFEEEKCNIQDQNESELQKLEETNHYGFEQASNKKGWGDSLSLSDSKMVENNCGGRKYEKMFNQMQAINKLVEMANGAIDDLPFMGSALPDLINLSDQVRDDDLDFQSQASQLRINSQSLTNETQQINLNCLGNQEQLQSLRVALEDIFGLENFITLYKFLEAVIIEKGLNFNEEEIIRKSLKMCLQIDQVILRRHFRLIVTVITLENELQQL